MDVSEAASLREVIRRNLLRCMDAAGLSQAQLAQRLGISKGTVNNWARGNNSPDLDMMPELCAALGVPLFALYSPFDGDDGFYEGAKPPLSDAALDLALRFDRLDAAGRGAVLAITAYEERRMNGSPENRKEV